MHLRRSLPHPLSLTFTLVLLIVLSACTPQASENDGRKKIGAIVFQEDQYFRLVEYGMRDAAREMNVNLMVNNSFGAMDKEIALIDTYIASRVDAIVVAPLSAQSSIAALRRAHEGGIPVITYDSYLDADFDASNIRSDQVQLGHLTGQAAVKFIVEKLGGKAKVGLVEYVSLAPEPASQRVKGFKDQITTLPGVEIVTEQDAWLAPEATVLVENMLTAHPEINLIWAANEGGTVGAVNAVTGKNRAGEVFVFGTDMSEQIGTFLLAEKPVLQAVTGQKPFDIGRQSVLAAVNVIDKKPVEKKVAMPGVLFSTEKPQEVRDYMSFLEKVAR
ncbi:MAG: sugar ABC transporter substrate-binding protein [Candidatus Omnitrophica bacterium COP1]|nr:sugar ABC transporter substrate-binding protein [Candidatus Omnitrophica bacterium COP1]